MTHSMIRDAHNVAQHQTINVVMLFGMKAFGENLRHYMERDGYTAIKVAQIAGVERQQVYRWLNGKSDVREGVIEKLAAAFRCEPYELRYGVSVGSPTRVKDAAEAVLLELARQGKTPPPANVAAIIEIIYDELNRPDGRSRPSDISKLINVAAG